MELFTFYDNNQVYRVRKEDEGCTVFSSTVYLEGNDTLFYIIKLIKEIGVNSAIKEILDKFEDETKMVQADLIDLSNNLIEEDVLVETAHQIINYFLEEK